MDARRSPAQQVAAQPAPPGPLGGAGPSPSGSGAGLLPACVAGTLGPSAKAAGTLGCQARPPPGPGSQGDRGGLGQGDVQGDPEGRQPDVDALPLPSSCRLCFQVPERSHRHPGIPRPQGHLKPGDAVSGVLASAPPDSSPGGCPGLPGLLRAPARPRGPCSSPQPRAGPGGWQPGVRKLFWGFSGVTAGFLTHTWALSTCRAGGPQGSPILCHPPMQRGQRASERGQAWGSKGVDGTSEGPPSSPRSHSSCVPRPGRDPSLLLLSPWGLLASGKFSLRALQLPEDDLGSVSAGTPCA